MNPIDQLCHCNDVRDIAEGSEDTCHFCFCSPSPMVQIVILSNADGNLSSDRFVPQKIVDLANQAVKTFALNPAQVVWVEHIPAKGSNSACAGFNLINFDWYAGQATSPHRSPISEDWYLSWLETAIDLYRSR